MSKHTPGPWTAINHGNFVNSDNGLICRMSHAGTAFFWATGPADLENTANAQLLAASPEMLEALKKCLIYTEHHPALFHNIKNLINKAEG